MVWCKGVTGEGGKKGCMLFVLCEVVVVTIGVNVVYGTCVSERQTAGGWGGVWLGLTWFCSLPRRLSRGEH